jgi:hypothetical protein
MATPWMAAKSRIVWLSQGETVHTSINTKNHQEKQIHAPSFFEVNPTLTVYSSPKTSLSSGSGGQNEFGGNKFKKKLKIYQAG